MNTPQALIRTGNHIIDLRSIRFADLSMPTDDESDSWPELFLVFDRYSTTLHGDEALAVWGMLCHCSTPLELASQQAA